MAPEDYGPVLVVGMPEHFMKLDSEAIEMTNVQRAKVGVKGIV